MLLRVCLKYPLSTLWEVLSLQLWYKNNDYSGTTYSPPRPTLFEVFDYLYRGYTVYTVVCYFNILHWLIKIFGEWFLCPNALKILTS